MQVSANSHNFRFRFKICQTVAGTSMTCQFHEFFRSNFGGILLLGSTVQHRGRRRHRRRGEPDGDGRGAASGQ